MDETELIQPAPRQVTREEAAEILRNRFPHLSEEELEAILDQL
ncbi:hypothetical protein BH11ARM1_BH11ARM1_03040 [soil metagenome]